MIDSSQTMKRIRLKLRKEDTIDIICFNCTYFDTMRIGGCKAFPGQIPNIILNGQSDHHQVMKGQRGDYVYTPIVAPVKMWGRLERASRSYKRSGKRPIIENWT
jgi:hypothetical protein